MSAQAELELPSAAAGDTGAKKKSSKLVLIVGLVTLVIVAQVVITYLLMPKGEIAKTTEAGPGAAAPQAKPEDPAEINDGPELALAEVIMGDFNCTNSRAAPGMIIHVDMKLAAITNANQKQTLDEQLKMHQARVRQVVSKIVRSSSLEDLQDPSLGTIKRLVREEVNRLLRKSLILEIVVSDIRTIEQ